MPIEKPARIGPLTASDGIQDKEVISDRTRMVSSWRHAADLGAGR
jgi:hypothetical protein